MRPVLPRYGLLQISGIAKILNSHLRASTFEELKIPFYVAATNLNKGRIEYFSEGELLYPVIASSSIPVLFKPVVINKYSYVDGGVMDNLPIKPIENLCRFFIGSFVNPLGDQEEFSSLIDIAARIFILNLYKELRNYNILDPEKAEDLFNIGYEATNNLLEKTGFLKILFSPVEKDNK
jgi:NTE family protein